MRENSIFAYQGYENPLPKKKEHLEIHYAVLCHYLKNECYMVGNRPE